MTDLNRQSAGVGNNSGRRSRWPWFLAACGLAVVLIALLLPRSRPGSDMFTPESKSSSASASGGSHQAHPAHGLYQLSPNASPEEVVSNKVSQFARSRRDIFRAMAERRKIQIPELVDQFFAAAEANRWEDVDSLYKSLLKMRQSGTGPPELNEIWSAIQETLGVAEQAHSWPAQKLLDYGNAILNSLGPNTVYVGGTDPGRFIPTLLNETGDGNKHIVLTQNALADGTYLEYLNFLYGDRMATLGGDDSQKAFQNYLSDAQKRLQHDQQSPDEAKQIDPGEDIKVNEGRVQVSGQIAVMKINELLLQNIMQKNPDLSFALEESFPLRSTYGDATILGPIMELRAQGGQQALTPQTASQAVDYWRTTTQQMLADPETPDGSNPRKEYSQMAQAQANLLAAHNYNAEAEQAYRLAMQLSPDSATAAYGFAQLLDHTGRSAEAQQIINDFDRQHPQTGPNAIPKPFFSFSQAPTH